MILWKLALLINLNAVLGDEKIQNFLNHLMATIEPYQGAAKLQHIDDMQGLAGVEGAGAHRGPSWYDYDTSIQDSESDLKGHDVSSSLTLNTVSKSHERKSSGASSTETKEKRLATRVYRQCIPCPMDMIKEYKNIGIKWICGAYQRARRSFKSDCMMRYRNCQDGTLFVKVSEHRCSEDPYHGRSWFYEYRT